MDNNELDVSVQDEGTIVSFVPKTERAKAWFEEHVMAEDWQWMGPALCVDYRYAEDLIAGLQRYGFTVA